MFKLNALTMIVALIAWCSLGAAADPLEPYSSKAVEQYPNALFIKRTPYFEIYWGFEGCRSGCDGQNSDQPLNQEYKQKLAEVEPYLEQVLGHVLSRFDLWAASNVEKWSLRRAQVFPVTIVISPFYSTWKGTSTLVGKMDYEDAQGHAQTLTIRPIVTIGVKEGREKWSSYESFVAHEFGHVLLYSLGISEYLSPLDEAFADLLALTLNPGTSVFVPEFAADYRAYLKKNLREASSERQGETLQRWLRVSSERAVRDFTLANA